MFFNVHWTMLVVDGAAKTRRILCNSGEIRCPPDGRDSLTDLTKVLTIERICVGRDEPPTT